MTEQERNMWQQMIDIQTKHIDKMQSVLFWIILLCFACSGLFVSVTINTTIQHRIEVNQIVHDYFVTDYDYGTIEQTVNMGGEDE